MTTDLRDQLSFARDVEPTQDEIVAVRTAVRQRSARDAAPRWRRRLRHPASIVAALALAVPAGAVATGAFDDTLGSFLGLAKTAPLTVDPSEGSVIDQQQGVEFTVTRNKFGDICLQLDGSIGLCGTAQDDDWGEQLADRSIAAVGTVPPRGRDQTRIPLFVLTAPDVNSVEVRYSEGAATTRRVGNRGAVVIADADRDPQTVVALDAAGTEVGSAELNTVQWSWCRDINGCPDMNTP